VLSDLLAVLVEKVPPLQTELRLEAARSVVNAGMNDFAVTAAGLLPKGSVALDQHNGKRPRTGAGKAFCQCQPNDASADYTKFKVFHWRPDFV
jgi:putative hemolysin